MIKILLIDNHPAEKIILRRNLKRAAYSDFEIKHVKKCSDAMGQLLKSHYHIVLLENSPDETISPDFYVPFIRSHLQDSPIVIISNDIHAPRLKSPEELGVDYIIDKTKLPSFMMKILPIFEAQALI